jgi:mono/diheme cytochrome c family protein
MRHVPLPDRAPTTVRCLRIAAAAALCLAGCAGPETTPSASASAATIDPARIYLRNCSACHGERGDGRGLAQSVLVTTPRDFTADPARVNLSREYMIAIVRDGRPHTAMAGRGERLSQPQIEATVDFIRAAFIPPEPGSALAQARSTYRQSCARCHGDRGQGVMGRAGQPSGPPLARHRVRSALGAAQMTEAILRPVHSAAGPAAAAALAPADAVALVDYIRSTFIEISSASVPKP